MKMKVPTSSKFASAVVNKKTKPKDKEDVRCYNCGYIGPQIECDSKNKGMKCFNCNEFGHKALECTKRKIARKKEEASSKIESVNSLDAPRSMYKIIMIRNKKLNALVGTGTHLILLTRMRIKKLNRQHCPDPLYVFRNLEETEWNL